MSNTSTTTTISVSKKLRAKLDKLGDTHEETYNQIVERLIKQSKEKNKK